MTSKQFLGLVACGVLLMAAVIIPLNMYLDIFGLFRTAQGRHISVYGEERVAKYLHTYRYIPDNFDGVLLGSSVSDNLHTENVGGFRLYNASITGGNVEDVRAIADNLFQHHRYKLTIICIHRYLTLDHVEKTAYLTPKEYWAALGSPQLLTAYVSRMAARRGMVRHLYDNSGTHDNEYDPRSEEVSQIVDRALVDIRNGTALVGNYHIDPIALAELRGVVDLAREHSDKLVIFYPPVPAPVLSLRSREVARYRDAISSFLLPTDIVVDFNEPKYADIRGNPRNYVDTVHLSTSGARLLMSELAKAVVDRQDNRSATLRP